jgi:hypothetical protein
MSDILNLAVPITLVIVLIVLIFGMVALFRGGDYARSNSNKLMRWRVIAQFAAVVALMGALWFKTGGPGVG